MTNSFLVLILLQRGFNCSKDSLACTFINTIDCFRNPDCKKIINPPPSLMFATLATELSRYMNSVNKTTRTKHCLY